MWAIKMNPEDVVEVNYQDFGLPRSFLAFKPILFKDGQMYCCLLGPNQKKGIFGFGHSIQTAITYWDLEFKKRLIDNRAKDPIARFVTQKIKMGKNLQIF